VIGRLGRVACHGAAKWHDCVGVRAGARHDDSDRIERQRVARLELERLLRCLESLAWPVQCDQAAAALRQILGSVGRQREGAVDDLDGLAIILMLSRDDAEQEQRVGVLRVRSQNLEAELVGEAIVAPIQRVLRLFMPLSYHAVRKAPSSS
jgi:hypothetical protein